MTLIEINSLENHINVFFYHQFDKETNSHESLLITMQQQFNGHDQPITYATLIFIKPLVNIKRNFF